ncbi:MAG TPA: 3-hydroxyacyl-ACP dehydratase FabZ [Desulfobacterales bacterium]|jgi:beta-hydroxyacyl-ACP dehydratase FabZ|nr:3-hydroxyacyl-ACP dehydratase FabZ [Desulfobacterales bacterium]HSM88737.1 3-hydroxyacyl-ACP dehydratase FabZ [Desulfobacterales bacterium]
MDTVLDILAIMQRLPHRYPFLLIDRIVRFVPGEEIVALKNVTMNEPFFQGHFPAKPVMPGVLIIEALAQAGGILAAEIRGPEKQGDIIYFMGMDAVRFRKPVVPGDQLMLEARVLRMRSRVAKMAGRALVDGQLVAEAELMASFGESA